MWNSLENLCQNGKEMMEKHQESYIQREYLVLRLMGKSMKNWYCIGEKRAFSEQSSCMDEKKCNLMHKRQFGPC